MSEGSLDAEDAASVVGHTYGDDQSENGNLEGTNTGGGAVVEVQQKSTVAPVGR